MLPVERIVWVFLYNVANCKYVFSTKRMHEQIQTPLWHMKCKYKKFYYMQPWRKYWLNKGVYSYVLKGMYIPETYILILLKIIWKTLCLCSDTLYNWVPILQYIIYTKWKTMQKELQKIMAKMFFDKRVKLSNNKTKKET